MSQFGEFARWFSKRLIIGIVLMGVALAAWNWEHQGEKNGARAAVHEEPETAKAEPQNHQGRSESPLAPPSHPPLLPRMANDQWPENIRQLSRQDQRRRLYIYLPPNVSMEEAERW